MNDKKYNFQVNYDVIKQIQQERVFKNPLLKDYDGIHDDFYYNFYYENAFLRNENVKVYFKDALDLNQCIEKLIGNLYVYALKNDEAYIINYINVYQENKIITKLKIKLNEKKYINFKNFQSLR